MRLLKFSALQILYDASIGMHNLWTGTWNQNWQPKVTTGY
jgi:hypothetical protein